MNTAPVEPVAYVRRSSGIRYHTTSRPSLHSDPQVSLYLASLFLFSWKLPYSSLHSICCLFSPLVLLRYNWHPALLNTFKMYLIVTWHMYIAKMITKINVINIYLLSYKKLSLFFFLFVMRIFKFYSQQLSNIPYSPSAVFEVIRHVSTCSNLTTGQGSTIFPRRFVSSYVRVRSRLLPAFRYGWKQDPADPAQLLTSVPRSLTV